MQQTDPAAQPPLEAVPPPPAPPVDPVLAHLMRPTVQTGEGQFAGIVIFLTGVFVLAVGEHWVYVSATTEAFVLTWIPLLVPAVLGSGLIASRTALKLFLGRRYVAAQESIAAAPTAALTPPLPYPPGTARAG